MTHKLPLDVLYLEFIQYISSVLPQYSPYVDYKERVNAKSLATILHDNTLAMSEKDIADILALPNRDMVQRTLSNHHKFLQTNIQYEHAHNTHKFLLRKYREIKASEFSDQKFGPLYLKYRDKPQAVCVKTGKDIMVGDFICGSSMGGQNFLDKALVEIGENILGIQTSTYKIPLFASGLFDDVIQSEKLYLREGNNISQEWRAVI